MYTHWAASAPPYGHGGHLVGLVSAGSVGVAMADCIVRDGWLLQGAASSLPAVLPPALAGASRQHVQQPQTTASYLTCPMQCRGMNLLGVVHRGSKDVWYCVHQVSAELWRMYDTPRVSVQKKIEELRIELSHCDRELIGFLRKAGLIEGFRATMIRVRDTERLFDALEESRKKRGLEKHALKNKCDPAGRTLRVEEKRARRLEILAARPRPPAQRGARSSWCALNGMVRALLGPGGGESVATAYEEPRLVGTGQLLVARDAEELCSAYCYDIETVAGFLTDACAAPIPTLVRGSGQPRRSASDRGPPPLIAHPMEQRPLQVPISTCGSVLDSPKSTSSLHRPPVPYKSASRLSSPTLESSEFEEQSSTYSHSSLARSCSTSPRRHSSTPERFLFLDSDSADSEPNEAREESEAVKTVAEVGFSQGAPNETKQSSIGQHHKKPATLKLLHLAQASSPPNCVIRIPPLASSPLLVSIPVSMCSISGKDDAPSGQDLGHGTGVSQKQRRGVALSSFAMKKRADAPTFPSGADVKFEMGAGLPPPSGRGKRGRGRPRGSRARGRRQHTLSASLPSPTLSSTSTSATTKAVGESPSGTGLGTSFVFSDGLENPFAVSGSLKNLTEVAPKQQEATGGQPTQLKTAAEACGPQDDDQVSVASSSTTSSRTAPVPGRRTSRPARANLPAPEKQAFSLERLFGFCGPPKLVVRDGELVPEQSLSTKGLDRQSIPDNHPVFSWTLGQPVKGPATTGRRRKRKAHAEE